MRGPQPDRHGHRPQRAVCSVATALLIATAHVAGAHELPVGDGKVSTQPRSGHVYACQTRFRGGGARHVGDWFHGDTWNPLEKPHVQGRVMWPQASLSIRAGEQDLEVSGNSLPVGQPTGVFPIATDDPVYRFDTNPNGIEAVALDFRIPLVPERSDAPACLPMGMIGFTLTGVALYNALDDAGHDAAAHEVQDLCNGHPQGKGQYHYHNASPCMPGWDTSRVVGWALDGFPILGMRDAAGGVLHNEDLDACHGRAEQVRIEGREYAYAYRLTAEYPYTLGCFSGRVAEGTRQAIRQSMGPPRLRGPQRGPSP